ncbi:hypothetical protein ACEUW3_03425 [Staphylococcus pseudintermedius]|uniref:hypothetical protein n=1 Tax=Staphylococcus pseudintermedius TaxID=283734 RepID=UPI0007AED9F7|nr:hypothetical protein [Staphylococcus pseudintermedius]EGQ2687456.1 hypothetical protein [Staphylococcus pseudintermedius]EIE3871346.1 hypothetical protein [Staphylococcus pseudintermedius]EJO7205863.1 hypothetical protein [Staphylococcus pseudintermedius]KZK22251.1 hypothetical protein NO88_07895 [Staphylococcus pseudintermedius]KZK26630.1 hypothetical protein NO89_06945 [Staphylococcus pseudintermedius]
MDRTRIIRGVLISIILGLLFFFLNQTQSTYTTTELLLRSVLVAIVFAVLYFVVFTILSHDTRRRIYGPPLLIGIILGILVGQWLEHAIVGLALGVAVGLIVGAIRQSFFKE